MRSAFLFSKSTLAINFSDQIRQGDVSLVYAELVQVSIGWIILDRSPRVQAFLTLEDYGTAYKLVHEF